MYICMLFVGLIWFDLNEKKAKKKGKERNWMNYVNLFERYLYVLLLLLRTTYLCMYVSMYICMYDLKTF